MATVDYGGILVKNGKIFQNDDQFMMTTDLGYQLPEGVNSYATVGDEKFAVAVWKANIYVIINGNVAHHAVAKDIQCLVIALNLSVLAHGEVQLPQPIVIIIGLLEYFGVILLGQRRQHLLIVDDRPGLHLGVHILADSRI